jgi:hypothetical protein
MKKLRGIEAAERRAFLYSVLYSVLLNPVESC